MILSFKLDMPNVGSWDGRWFGEGKKYYLHKNLPKKEAMVILDEKETNSWYYNFGDGWGASVSCRKVTSYEKQQQQKNSAGFSGYDWMVDEIIQYGKILTKEERMKKKEK